MAFVLALMYLALSLLSPGIFPVEMAGWHLPAILGVLAILTTIPIAFEGKVGSALDIYFAIGATAFVGLSIVFAMHWIGGAITQLSDFLPIVCGFFFILVTCRSLQRMKILAVVLFLVATFIFVQGLLALVAGDITNPYVMHEHEILRLRGLGMIADPNDYGQFMVTIIPLLWLRWEKGRSGANFMLTLVPTAILVVAIFFTHSRGTVIGLGAILLFGFKDKLGRVKAGILVGIVMAAIVGLGVGGGRGMTDDDGGRVELWGTALHAFATHPLFGIGMGNMKDYTDTQQTAHNSYVLAMAELGIFGYYSWLVLLVSNWSGLTRIIGSRGLPGVPGKAAGAPAMDRSRQRVMSGTTAPLNISVSPDGLAVARSGGYPISSPSLNARATTVGHLKSNRFSAPSVENLATGAETDVDMAYAAHIIRTAFVGTLVTCFFLSRSFSLVLYIILGIGAALRSMYDARHPERAIPRAFILKRTGVIAVCLIVALYIMLRVMGALGMA